MWHAEDVGWPLKKAGKQITANTKKAEVVSLSEAASKLQAA